MKSYFAVFALLFVCTVTNGSLTDILAGLASTTSAAGADVASIVACVDDATANNIQTNIQALIAEGSSCDPTKITDITSKLNAVLKSFTDDQKKCLNGNTAAKQITDGFKITGLPVSQIQTKAIAYIMGHLITACTSIKGLNTDIQNGDWKKFGSDAGVMIQKVFLKSALIEFFNLKELNSAKDNLSQMIVGLASATPLEVDTDEIINCTSDATVTSVLDAVVSLIAASAACNPTSVPDIEAKFYAIVQGFPADEKQCVANTAAVQKFAQYFNVAGLDVDQIKNKAVAYLKAHLVTACTDVKNLNKDLQSGQFKQFGIDGAPIIKKTFA